MISGTCNNPIYPELGTGGKCITRLLPPDYGPDPTGYNSIRMAKPIGKLPPKELPNARFISNAYMKDQKIDDPDRNLMFMMFVIVLFSFQLINKIISHPQFWPSHNRDGLTCNRTSSKYI